MSQNRCHCRTPDRSHGFGERLRLRGTHSQTPKLTQITSTRSFQLIDGWSIKDGIIMSKGEEPIHFKIRLKELKKEKWGGGVGVQLGSSSGWSSTETFLHTFIAGRSTDLQPPSKSPKRKTAQPSCTDAFLNHPSPTPPTQPAPQHASSPPSPYPRSSTSRYLPSPCPYPPPPPSDTPPATRHSPGRLSQTYTARRTPPPPRRARAAQSKDACCPA